jgi:PilZ domain
MPVRTLDVSATGVLVESLLPIQIGSVVRVRATDVPMLCGIATVRHCARRGLAYGIGLEFEASFNRRF